MATEKEIQRLLDEKRFGKSPEEEAKDQAKAQKAMDEAQAEIKIVLRKLLDHTEHGVEYLFRDDNCFNGNLIIDWSVEAAEQFLKDKEAKEAKLYANEMGDVEAANFVHSWINYIQHCMRRKTLRIFMPDSVTDEDFEEAFPDLCLSVNQEEEEERIQARCKEIHKAHKDEAFVLDGDGFYDEIVKRTEEGLNRVDRKLKAKAPQKV